MSQIPRMKEPPKLTDSPYATHQEILTVMWRLTREGTDSVRDYLDRMDERKKARRN